MPTPANRPIRITLDLPTALLADIDRVSARIGVARAAWIKITLANALVNDALERKATHGTK
jgi:metal-responsive CopG/Arc/MetJ family transcriptional regulator